ncbi:MAG: hypothetical protein ABI617_05580 [Sphingomicrobium sp.]
MIAAFATIVFLAAAWAAIVAVAGSLEQSLGKIGAALRGEILRAAPAPIALRVSQRYPSSRSQRVRARSSLRAAA